ncbi:MAG: hypothetical protein IKZ13_05485 [Akkermansia sp.]|nr:hypothetical protein [Akkermansia sp.]
MYGEEAVTAAKAMWQSDPQSVAMATLGCDFAEAANPYGCNQYGHGFKEPHSGYGSGVFSALRYKVWACPIPGVEKDVDIGVRESKRYSIAR